MAVQEKRVGAGMLVLEGFSEFQRSLESDGMRYSGDVREN